MSSESQSEQRQRIQDREARRASAGLKSVTHLTLYMTGSPLPPLPPKVPRRLGTGVVLAVIAAAIAVVVVVAALRLPTHPATQPQTFEMYGTSVDFVGSAASEFEVLAGFTCEGYECGSGQVGDSIGLYVGIVPDSWSCSDLGEYQVTQVSASEAGAFVLISAKDIVTQQLLEFSPVSVPSGNATSCGGGADFWVTVQVVDQGPPVQALYLTFTVS